MKKVLLCFDSPEGASSRRGWSGARLATRGQRRLLGSALCLAAIACAVLMQRWWILRAELDQSNAALQAISTRRMPALAAHEFTQPILSANELKAWTRLANALNTPWNTVFDTLEDTVPTQVALISIEPDAANASLRLEAEAGSLDALLGGVRALGEAKGIAQVILVKHETLEQTPGGPVRLVVNLQLKRSTP